MDDDTGDCTRVTEPSDGASSTAVAARADGAGRVVCDATGELIVQQDDDNTVLACTHQEEGEGDSSPTEEVEEEEPEGEEEEEEEEELKQELELKREETVKERLERLRKNGRFPLHTAAKKGDLDDVKFLLQHGKSVNDKNWFSETALLVAAMHGHLDVVRELIDRGAVIDAKYKYGRTPLALAAASGHLTVVRELIDRGAAVDAKDNNRRTPLSCAATSGRLDVVRELIDRGAAVDSKGYDGGTPLSCAAASGRLGVVRELIDRGAAVDAEDKNGRTSLWRAAWSGHLDVVRELIDCGAAVDAKHYGGETPLWCAADSGHLDVVRELIDRGAAVDAKHYGGETPLWCAAGRGRLTVVRELIDRGAAVDAKDNNRRTPLSCAAASGHLAVVRELINCGAAVDVKHYGGETPLWRAAASGHLAVVRELIDCGAAVDAEGKNGKTSLSRAAASGHLDVVRELIDRDAAVDAEDYDGKTPLLLAADSGHLDVVRELIDRGAAVDSKGYDGGTPLWRAAASGHLDVARELIDCGAAVDAKYNDGRTPLWVAVDGGHLGVVRELIDRDATVDAEDDYGKTPLWRAADRGHLDVVRELIDRGAAVDAKDNNRRTPLWVAADSGHLDVVRELIDRGAAVDSKYNDGGTPLWRAADRGHLDVVRELIDRGAVIDAKDNDGETPLSRAAVSGRLGVVRELIDRGAAVDAKDKYGRTPLLRAADLLGRLDVVRELIDCGADVDAKDNDGKTPLSYVAARGHVWVAKELIADGALVDAASVQGRTPLFYAAEHGHTDMVQLLLRAGTSLWTKAHPSQPRRESETPLLLAGRSGHMKTFQFLINAGAPVNVRSGEDGETPLISAARLDFFAGVQLLIASGGCLCEDEVVEDEYPLIPGTLKTMRLFCNTTFEFEPMCSRVLIQLEEICSKLQEAHAMRAKESTLVSFASILFRFCRLQIDINKRESPLLRFIASRAIVNRIRDFHEELDHFVGMLALEQNENRWKEQWQDDQTQLLVRFGEKLSTDEALLYGFDSEATKQETAVLLLYELKISRQEKQRPELQASLERVVERFLRVCNMDAPVIPEWFISRDDVEFQSWNLVGSEGYRNNKIQYYEGKWRKTAVVIETCPDASTFEQSATQWHQLNHPNVVKLFGACHIGSPPFFIYELETQGVQLQGFLNKDVNRPLVWKCLYEAALGLRYLHSRGVAHGFLQSKSFTVGSGITKLNGTRQIGIQRSGGYVTSTDAWLPPEASDLFPTASSDIDFSHSEAYDIYAFGICIWEALIRELPWRGAAYLELRHDKRFGRLPDRPASIGYCEWELITKMCTAKPSERVKMNYVVNRLSKFVITRDQVSEAARQNPLPSTEIEDKTIDGHVFAELNGGTILNALQYIGSRSEKLEGHHWMSSNVYPALEYIFALLQERHKIPMDTEVLQFCTFLSRFQRYLRTAVSKKSVYELARSRRVAEVHYVVYAELDRLLNALDVPETDPIRVWRHNTGTLNENRQVGGGSGRAVSKSHPEKANANSSAVTLIHFDTPPATHNLWTRAGLAAASDTPTWFLSLRDLVFSKSDEIGRGSFGSVYKGTWLGTPIVIKFMGYEEDFDTIPTNLLLHEVRVWYRLNHPHVLKMYGACHMDKRYFVCEYASNGELNKYLSKPGNEHLMWEKLYEAALGLEYMHGQNVAHNDLKCDNIMVGMDGKAKLIDFGLSCVLNEVEIQVDVKKMGAVNWKSPEYLAGGRPSFASDVYSFAMCIIEVVSGEAPWVNTHPAGVRFQLKRGNIPNLPDSTNEKQQNLIQLMTKFNPAERVNMRFVVDKLNEIAYDERARVGMSQ